MVTKDDRPGLLSKVAMFVRNPTKDWAELDQPMDSDAAGYDKQALKAMIERKRQNDFVRKREFDQLRKLRNRDPGAMANMARPSFFQTSLPTDLDGRAVTLKKIDEIEAQMSRQWWRSKNEGGATPNPISPHDHATQHPLDQPNSEPYQGHSAMSAPFASTQPNSERPAADADFADDFLPTQMASYMASVPGLEGIEGQADRTGSNVSFSTSRLFAIEVDEMATDPELEEAAIRFANSDDAGAEKGLLAALRGNDLAPHAAQSWAAALLDLYRATKNYQAFEDAAIEFAVHLDGAWPVWAALGEAESGTPLVGARQNAGPIWDCPATLTAEGMETLRLAMVSNPMPWHLGWGMLESIAPDAVPLLDGLFGSLCDEAVTLRFASGDRVISALRALTPSGHRTVEPRWWLVRLNALRAMGLQDDFELAALDYCVTYETAPPAWVDPCCRFEGATQGGAQQQVAQDFGSHTVPMGMGPGEGNLALVLLGEILGDASLALAKLDNAQVMGQRMYIDCSNLVRVDFAAGGSILNWVAMCQADGKQVQFQNVHRLVAAFFNVIGINEHAKVVPSAI